MKSDAQTQEKEMSFWEHLEELRSTIIWSAAAILVLSVIAFLNREIIFDRFILWPLDPEFITNRVLCRISRILSLPSLCFEKLDLRLINIQLSGQFLMHMQVSFVAGLVLAFPFVVYKFWQFIIPALKTNERSHSRRAVFVISLLFLFGVLFSYFLIIPLTINFLGGYHVSSSVANQIALTSYVQTLISVILGVGIVFELPVLVFFLARIGLVTAPFMRRNRKYMLVIILTLSAIITPPDVFSQILVSIPLLLLYEASIHIAAKVNPEESPGKE